MKNKKPIYIIGHKNPDSDAIISSIAYHEYLKHHNIKSQACRLGEISKETEYLLNEFDFDVPRLVNSAKCRISEIEYDEANYISKESTINDALEKILKTKSKMLCVVDKNKKLEGIISLSQITGLLVEKEDRLKKLLAKAELDDIIKCLNGKILFKASKFEINGKVIISPSNTAIYEKCDLIVTSNSSKVLKAIEKGVSLIIYLENTTLNKEIFEKARTRDTTIIYSPLTSIEIAKKIYFTIKVKELMVNKDEVLCCSINNTVDEVYKIIGQTRFRSYPILDSKFKVVGAISRYHLFNYERKRFILVDHSEKKQSIDDIDDGIIKEIIDHHRIADFKSNEPINFITLKVGACSTIIAKKFFEEDIKLNKRLAGLMLGAILSDTLNLKSPTTSKLDKKIALKLEKISQCNKTKLFNDMVDASVSLKNKSLFNILFDDFKEYTINNLKIGLAQTPCKNCKEFEEKKNDLSFYISNTCERLDYDLLIIMLTYPNGQGSHLIAGGNKKDIVYEVFNVSDKGFVKKLVSRKMQLLPSLISYLDGNW